MTKKNWWFGSYPIDFFPCVGSIASSCCEQLVLRGLPISTRLWVTAFGLKASGGRQASLAQLSWIECLNSQTDWQRFEINFHLIYKCIEIVLMCANSLLHQTMMQTHKPESIRFSRQFTANCTKFNTEKRVLIYANYVRSSWRYKFLFIWHERRKCYKNSPHVQLLIEEFTLIP